jgi:hypothetical protein
MFETLSIALVAASTPVSMLDAIAPAILALVKMSGCPRHRSNYAWHADHSHEIEPGWYSISAESLNILPNKVLQAVSENLNTMAQATQFEIIEIL